MNNNFSDLDRVLGKVSSQQHDTGLNLGKTLKYRPTRRPPMAILQIFDDGCDSCETIRVREDRTTIGRSKKCTVCIPHDTCIESQHVVVKRVHAGNKFSWIIQSASDSSDGLFVRVRRTKLRDNSEFLVGRQRVRFTDAGPASVEAKALLTTRLDRGSIPGQSSDPDVASCASLCLVTTPNAPKIWLLGSEYWIGRSPECALCIPGDPFLAPKHVKVLRQASGEWHAQTEKVPNGLWIRVPMMKVKSSCTFQIGEQKMRLTIC